ncbi:MAG: 1-phosphofructokinase family hexose kinase [Verrucomicrobiota bacterium]
MSKIITLTMNPSLDVSGVAEQVTPEDKIRCQDCSEDAGGGGINVARALDRLGCEATPVFPSGGIFGRRIQELLQEAVVEFEALPIDGKTRVNTSIREQGGRQFRFTMPGPCLAEHEWQKCLAALEQRAGKDSIFVLSGSLPPQVPSDFYAQATERLHKLGALVILDTCGQPLREAAQASPDWIKPNRRELAELTDTERDGEAIHEQARELVASGKYRHILLSLGAEGARLFSAETEEHIPSPDVEPKSRTGAGDSMVAGLVAALSQGKSPREAARSAVAAGAAAVMTPGTELLRADDHRDLLNHMQ